jgi:hypothetical protein
MPGTAGVPGPRVGRPHLFKGKNKRAGGTPAVPGQASITILGAALPAPAVI